MFAIMLLSYIIVAALDTRKLFEKREYGKLAVYYSLTLVSITIGVMIGIGIKVPSPSWPIREIVQSIVGK